MFRLPVHLHPVGIGNIDYFGIVLGGWGTCGRIFDNGRRGSRSNGDRVTALTHYRHLLVPQCVDRVEFARAPGRKKTGKQSYNEQQNRNPGKRRRIGGRYVKQQRAH